MKQEFLLIGKISIIGFICYQLPFVDHRFWIFIIAAGIIGHRYATH